MKKVALASIVLASSLFAGGFVSSKSNDVMSIAEIKNSARDDQMVTFRGYIKKQLDDDEYIVTDKKGNEIEVEIDDDKWNGLIADESTYLEIYGEVDRDSARDVEIDAKSVKAVK
ncbi:MAG: NirD/YgiW/YdeI family stress tolerance protein [Campylobacteraceae bacterium]|nr:NirD/YgiW/YdeI family stress tolerance protein [Campylobacteraceae bacterium]